MSDRSADPVEITQKLVQCPSVTPEEGGALDYLQELLKDAGFETHRLVFSDERSYDVDNLYARYGRGKPHFCYAGHTDVVPPGDVSAWTRDPFSGDIVEGVLHGRGAEDMKGSVAAFAAASINFIEEHPDFGGSISFLITGDEEADAVNGTIKVIEWADARGEAIDACIVGEPTNENVLGDSIKNGRRGSLSGLITVEGTQGHVAYPETIDNPIDRMVPILAALKMPPLDDGSASFPPSNLEITSVDVGNTTSNIVPARVSARFNVRYNDHWSSATMKEELNRRLKEAAPPETRLTVEFIRDVSEVFLTEAEDLIAPLQQAIRDVTGHEPALSTKGGTSDARFIKNYCPVVEFGLVNETLHQVNECVPVSDLKTLSDVYAAFLKRYFKTV
ncbi:MAG: succinyl-diaminopimelate desuccinylase [Pseudomonadota bacterium]